MSQQPHESQPTSQPMPTSGNPPAAPSQASASDSNRKGKSWLKQIKQMDTWWSILLLLFCVTAACGLPILWVSKAYRPAGKVGLTILVTLYTLAIFWIFWIVMVWSYQRIVNSF